MLILTAVAIAVAALDAAAQTRPSFDAFEVAAIKPTPPDFQGGRFITMQGGNRFVARNHTLKTLVAAAYNLNPRAISGGPAWADADHFDILASTPGAVRPNLDEQMGMLRKLLADRFELTFHRAQKEVPLYALTVAKNGPMLMESKSAPDAQPVLVNSIFPDRVVLPARNATMAQFASMMQRAVLDRPVVDKTGLTARYDFDLEWAPDETQFSGRVTVAASDPPKPDLFAAVQQQLGLRLEASKGLVEVLVIDRAGRPSEN
jgi:uncharacterized protein (TIGR03435 family)